MKALAMATHYNVRDFGAVGDGSGNNTEALQAAIDACAEAGGGIVFLPPGNYLTGTIFLKDNVNLHLSGGAVITGSGDLNDYKSSQYSRKSERDRTSGTHLIVAQNARNVSISGTGSVDGNASAFFEADSTGGRTTIKGDVRTSQMVVFCDCENVKISDVFLKNSPYWHLFIYGCREVQIRGVRIKSHPDTRTNDGLDIDSCVNVVVNDCLIESQDDCVTVRCDNGPFDDKRNCENISVANCVLRTDCCGVRVGVGSGEIRNVVFGNIVITNAAVGIDVIGRYTDKGEGVGIENVIFSNFIIHARVPFFLTPGYGGKKTVKRMSFDNIMAFAESCSYLGGLPDVKSSEISMSNVKFVIQSGVDNAPGKNDLISEWSARGYTAGSHSVKAPYGLWLEHLEFSEFKNIQIIMEDLNDVWLNAIKLNHVEKSKFESVVVRPSETFSDSLLAESKTDDYTMKTFNLKNVVAE